MADERFLMVAVQHHQAVALPLQQVHIGLLKRSNRGNHHDLRLFPVGEGEDKVQAFLSLVAEGFAQSHLLGPGSLERGVSYFYQ